MSNWATTPIDLRRGTVRRLFAQELVAQMGSIGAATRGELLTLPVLLFKVPPGPDELDQVTEVARRLDWLEKGKAPDEEWRVTESGRALRRPPSLAIPQVATRVLSVANPVRTQAKDWLPILALAAGTVTAGVARGVDTADAVRALSAAVLLGAVLWQFYGELQIVQAIKSWPRVQQEAACRPLKRLYSRPRLVVTAIMDATLIGAFTLVIFGAWRIGLATLAIAALAGIVHLRRWTVPVEVMVCQFAHRSPSWLVRLLS
jgi:hypothetical protein